MFQIRKDSLHNIKSLSLLNFSRSNKNYLFAFISNHLIYYPTPISLTYAWSFGFLAGMCLLTQMISGIFLAMHYTPHVDLAFSSVEYIMRDVPNGWFLRYVHANGASMFFIVVYSHIFRGLYYGSYMKPRELLWCSGVILFVLMMATAFTGYVLPWGQMSFWGATVITSMFTVIPVAGKAIVEWLWGGFTVNNPTLNRFFSFHFILPFLIAGVTLIHLALLHKDGSNNPIGSDGGIDDVPFYPYFVSKDMFAFCCFLLFFGTFVFYFPNVLNHPDNCIPADPMETPAHVVPEWYFLPFYAILRSIPNKAGGIIAMGGAIGVLFLIPFNNTSDVRNTTYRPIFKICYWVLIASWVVLTWIGQCPVEDIFAFVGQLATIYYYSFFIVLVPCVGKIESLLAHYNTEEIDFSRTRLLQGTLSFVAMPLDALTCYEDISRYGREEIKNENVAGYTDELLRKFVSWQENMVEFDEADFNSIFYEDVRNLDTTQEIKEKIYKFNYRAYQHVIECYGDSDSEREGCMDVLQQLGHHDGGTIYEFIQRTGNGLQHEQQLTHIEERLCHHIVELNMGFTDYVQVAETIQNSHMLQWL